MESSLEVGTSEDLREFENTETDVAVECVEDCSISGLFFS